MIATTTSQVAETAQQYLAAGLAVLPARRVEKRPAIGSWKRYQAQRPNEAEITAWFSNDHDALCVLCGAASGHMETLDFDAAGDRFDAWWQRIPSGLRDRLVIESTPADGWHVSYRSEVPVSGNLKLAQRKVGETITTLIETRGEGGLILCDPTPGYRLVQGEFSELPVLSEAERDQLLMAAWELNEYVPAIIDPPAAPVGGDSGHGLRPGEDFNARGDIAALLRQHDWALVRDGDNQYWRRPGKDTGWSATLKDGAFYVFSTSAAPFEGNKAYSPFAVYAMLEHRGDFAVAAAQLRREGYGDALGEDVADVDISALAPNVASPGEPSALMLLDPGPLPENLLYVPGFIGELMDHCLITAPYPNRVMAFCGALAMQAFLAGRKVRDCNNNRTNLYLLGLAHSAAGKDHPRKLNVQLAHQAGLIDCLGDKFASGEGVQDALFTTPSMLFQTDEIDGMLQSINKAKDARHENIMGTLLTLYSASNSVFPMRRKAGKDAPGGINQPNLVIFGTAIPNHYYEALSARMLSNGFFARMMILESGPRGQGQEPDAIDLPDRVVEIARWWANYQPNQGNLRGEHPKPALVPRTEAAQRIIEATRVIADTEWDKAHLANDQATTTVWGRVSEQTRKLALIYAVSENHKKPEISEAAAKWASEFVLHQTRRMLFMASTHVAETPFEAQCLKLMRKLRETPGQRMSHSALLQRMHIKAADFRELIQTLHQRGEIEVIATPRDGKPKVEYQAL